MSATQVVIVRATGQRFRAVSESTLEVMHRVYGAANVSLTEVVETPGGRYPFMPRCTCGAAFRGYANESAAQIVVDDHTCKG